MLRIRLTAVLYSIFIISCGGDDDKSTQITEEQRAEWAKISAVEVNTNRFVFDALTAGPETGTPVILLHGFPTTSDQYREILSNLGREGYYAIAPDQRGYSPGARPTEIEQYHLQFLTQDIIDIANSLELENFHLVGHDHGGRVAWAAGALHPDKLLSITSISTSHVKALIQALTNPESDQTERIVYAQALNIEGYESELLANNNALLLPFYADTDLDLIDLYLEKVANEATLDAALNWYHASEWQWTYALPDITVPTLYIWGDKDLYTGIDAAEATGDFVQGEYTFEILEGASHSIPETRPAEVTELLLEHFDGRS
ncbi:MAG: alpha/beta hydrolase [Agarilytica sp.]